jgi:hypothetical protein
MFSNLMISAVLGLAVGGWVYGKLQRYNGRNTQSSLTGAVLCGVIASIVGLTLLGLIF